MVNPIQQQATVGYNADVAYGQTLLGQGIRSRLVDNHNGCTLHLLEAGYEIPGCPCVLLLHGFPELALSWRNQLLPLAQAGFHVVAPDLRGYGCSGGTDVSFDDDLTPFTLLNRINDLLGLVHALGYKEVAAVVGHDYGSPVAAWCALARPDVFRSVVLMSAPFGGVPPMPVNPARQDAAATQKPQPGKPTSNIFDDLAALPVPRKHYQKYYATREANGDMLHAPGGVHNFLRAYYHAKSADWPPHHLQIPPHALAAKTASEWAKMPRYYTMDLHQNMAQTVAPEMPTSAAIAACQWLPDNVLAVYSQEYRQTGFQGGLQGYRVRWSAKYTPEQKLFAGRTIDVPCVFISGASDWGTYQDPGALEAMQQTACTQLRGVHLVPGAGHWLQQEQPERVNALLLGFL